jgi:predicted amidohydrolase
LPYEGMYIISLTTFLIVLRTARAIESQCYVLAAAQVGKHNEKRESYGHSVGEQHVDIVLFSYYQRSVLFTYISLCHSILIQPPVYDPWGELLADAGGYDGAGSAGTIIKLSQYDESPVRVPSIIVSDTDLDSISSVRERMPIQQHRDISSYSY